MGDLLDEKQGLNDYSRCFDTKGSSYYGLERSQPN